MGLHWDSMLGRGKDSLPTLGLLGKEHMLLPGKLSRPASRQALWCQREEDRHSVQNTLAGERKKKSMARTANPPQ